MAAMCAAAGSVRLRASPWRRAAALALAAALVGAAPGQDETAPAPLPPAHVLAVLDADGLDQARFLALVAAGPRAVPGLLAAVGDGSDQAPAAVRRRSRALRCLRLIGPVVADAAVPTLLAAVARDASRDDDELLVTLALLAPAVPDREALRATLREIRIEAPKARQDLTAFRRWVGKMRLWYDVQQRLEWGASDEVDDLVDGLDDDDPLLRRFAAERLGVLGPSATAAVEALIVVERTEQHPRVTRLDGVGSLTADFHDLVRDAAAIALARIEPRHPSSRRGLTLLLAADAPQERLSALAAMSPPADAADFDVVPAVLGATYDDDARIAAEAAATLGRLGDRRDEVLQRLRVCAAKPDRVLATCAAAALRALGD